VSIYYQDDYVTLYHGDCLEQTAWLDADVLVTDPPYGIAWTPRKGSYGKVGSNKTLYKIDPIANDDSIQVRDKALELWASKPAIVFGSWRAKKPKGIENRLIWHKAGMPPGPSRAPFMTNDEEIYVIGKGFRPSSPPLRSVLTTNEHRPSAVRDIGHPTPKPISLMELLIDRCPEGLIADPFAGSGSTLLAARNLGRKTVGVELNEEFCELIAKRLSQDTFDFSKLTEQVKETYTQESLI
jgi:site-specific DNA-methyltransferase (adenine-specific)